MTKSADFPTSIEPVSVSRPRNFGAVDRIGFENVANRDGLFGIERWLSGYVPGDGYRHVDEGPWISAIDRSVGPCNENRAGLLGAAKRIGVFLIIAARKRAGFRNCCRSFSARMDDQHVVIEIDVRPEYVLATKR